MKARITEIVRTARNYNGILRQFFYSKLKRMKEWSKNQADVWVETPVGCGTSEVYGETSAISGARKWSVSWGVSTLSKPTQHNCKSFWKTQISRNPGKLKIIGTKEKKKKRRKNQNTKWDLIKKIEGKIWDESNYREEKLLSLLFFSPSFFFFFFSVLFFFSFISFFHSLFLKIQRGRIPSARGISEKRKWVGCLHYGKSGHTLTN